MPHGVIKGLLPVSARHVRKPLAVFVGRVLADAANVGEHGKAQRIRIDASKARMRQRWLKNHVGVRTKAFDHESIAQQALVVHRIEQRVVPESRPAFVHDLRLPLRIEVLGNLAHDANDFALPGLQQGRIFLDEVQQIFLGIGGKPNVGFFNQLFSRLGQGTPQVIDLLLQVGFALLAPHFFLGQREFLRPLVTVNAVVHQGVAAVEQVFDGIEPVLLLALGNIRLGIHQVINDGRRIGPHPEQVVALEKGIVPVAGMGHDQGLHRQRVLLHQVRNAGV